MENANSYESKSLRQLRAEMAMAEQTMRHSEGFLGQQLRINKAMDIIRSRMNNSNDPPEKLLVELRSLFSGSLIRENSSATTN